MEQQVLPEGQVVARVAVLLVLDIQVGIQCSQVLVVAVEGETQHLIIPVEVAVCQCIRRLLQVGQQEELVVEMEQVAFQYLLVEQVDQEARQETVGVAEMVV